VVLTRVYVVYDGSAASWSAGWEPRSPPAGRELVSTGGPNEEDLAHAESLGRRRARYARWLKLGRGEDKDEVEGGLFTQAAESHDSPDR